MIEKPAQHSKAYWAIQHTRIKAMREALELQKARNDMAQRLGESSAVGLPDYLDQGIKQAIEALAK